MIGKSGTFRARATDRARPWNRSLTMATVGMPCWSRLIASWRLHVVQEPQCPTPTSAASLAAASSSMVSLGVLLEALGFFRLIVSLASYFPTARSA